MPARTLHLQYPLGGVDKRLAFQTQRPFTTPYAVNVRPEGTLEKRMRGGSRPGLVKSFSTRDSDNKVNLLTMMRSLNTEGRAVFSDDFSSGANWEEWVESGYALPTFLAGVASGIPNSVRGANLVSGSIPSIDTNAPFTLEARVFIYETRLAQGYSFYVGMSDAVPSPTASISVNISFSTDTHSADTRIISIAKNGLVLFTDVSFADLALGYRWLSFNVSPTGIVRVFMEGDLILEGNAAFTPVGNNVGFTINAPGAGAGSLEDLNVSYIASGGGVPPEAVIQATNGKLYRESTEGSLVAVANQTADLNSAEQLMAVDYLGKLYIADFSDNRTKQTEGSTAGVVNGVLDDSDVTDWTDLSIDKTTDVVELTGGSSGTGEFEGKTAGVYGITTIHPTNGLTLKKLSTGAALGAGDDLGTPEYRVLRGPKRYDSGTDTLDLWPADDMPVGCRIIEIFVNRIVFGGDPENPHVWYMSRYTDPDDWNYGASATDRGKAVSNAGASPDSSSLAIPLSAIVAGSEDYCLFSAESELYLLRGDPFYGATMGNISRQIGIGSRTAWCRVPDGSLVFLSRNGLYRYHPSQPFPENISRNKLPVELIDVVQNTALTVTMEYDIRFGGILIFIVPATASPTTHYWFDWSTRSFWPEPLGSSDYEPFAITYDAKANHVLLAGRDGYIRHHDSAAADDDGTAVAKQIDYGPIPLNRGLAAMADSLKITLDDSSDDVLWTFRSGNSPEEAFNAATRASGTAKAGVNYVQPVRHHDQWGFLRLSTSGAAKWAVEAIELYVLTTPARARKI